jgi:hypothetical protein
MMHARVCMRLWFGFVLIGTELPLAAARQEAGATG